MFMISSMVSQGWFDLPTLDTNFYWYLDVSMDSSHAVIKSAYRATLASMKNEERSMPVNDHEEQLQLLSYMYEVLLLLLLLYVFLLSLSYLLSLSGEVQSLFLLWFVHTFRFCRTRKSEKLTTNLECILWWTLRVVMYSLILAVMSSTWLCN